MTFLDLTRIINGLPEPMLLLGAESTVVGANPAAGRLFATSSRDLVGRPFNSLVTDEPERISQYLRLCRRTSQGVPGGFHLRTSNDEPMACKGVGGLAGKGDRQDSLVWLRLLPRESANIPFQAFNEHRRTLIETRKANTEREKAREALHESEERFRRIIEGVADYAIFMLDPSGRIVTWNVGAERTYGYPAREVLGQHFSMFYPQEDIDQGACEQMLDSAATLGRTEEETWRVRKDGSRFWANAVTTAIRDPAGTLVGFSRVIRDLTERKRAEQLLQLQASVLRYMPAAAWTLTPDGVPDFASEQWLAYSGQTLEYVCSAPDAWMAVLHADDRDRAERVYWTGIRSGAGFTMEARFRRASDGVYRWHLSRGVPLHDAEGRLVKFVGTSTDIDDLKRTEQELRTSEKRTRVIVDTALDAVVTMDADGMITGWNTQAEKIFGWTSGQAVGRRLSHTIIPSKYRDAHEIGLRRFLRTGEGPVLNKRIEIAGQHRDGREFPIELTVTAVKLGERWAFSAFLRDITERRRAEEALQTMQAELARVSRLCTVGELTASIAHEINQPLAAVVTNADVCRRLLSGDAPDLHELREAVADIADAGTRAGDVISRIRALLKKSHPETAPLDLGDLVREVLALTRSELSSKRVSVQTDLPSALPRVLGDRVQLQQVILNLILNAIEAMADITDRPRVLLIRSQIHQSGDIQAAVLDSGAGFDPQSQDRVFDAFFTTKPNGMGMGLSISRSIIEAHGGRLWASPNPDFGVTMYFTLPPYTQSVP